MILHWETVSQQMKDVLESLMQIEELNSYRLVGGTALALQLGHRTSVELDLIAGGQGYPENLPKVIRQYFENFEITAQTRNGVMVNINQIKVDLVDWKVPFTEDPLLSEYIRLATPSDIFASKCEALLDRKSEKDFVDIAIIASRFDLKQLFVAMKKRYSYLTTGAITAFLLRRDLIQRDKSIRYLNGFSFDMLADSLQSKIIDFEKNIVAEKEKSAETQEQKIRDLINRKKTV